MKLILKNRFNIVLLSLLVLLSLPSVLGLLHAGFPLTDDGNWMVVRFSAFYEVLRNGQFPVRFLTRLNNGFGYPVADFLYPGFMYLGVPIHILGLNFINTVKAILILSLFSSTIFSYYWFRKLFDNFSASVGALFYTYFPYHLFDVYKRGSVGEVLALSVLPFILWQIERKSLLWTSIGIALLILSHNTLALLFIPLVMLYILLKIKPGKLKLKFKNFTTLFFGLLISAFFWFPALFDLQYTVFGSVKVSDFAGYFSSFNLIGISSMFIILVTFTALKKNSLKTNKLLLLMLGIFIVSVFFSSSFSLVFWKFLPVSFIQFPFRFLSLAIPAASFLAAAVISAFPKNKQLILGFVVLVLMFFSALPFVNANSYQYYPDGFYSTNMDTTTVKNEYMPKWVNNLPVLMANVKVQNLTGKETINIIVNSPNKILFSTDLKNMQTIQINTVYFPGWEAFINGNNLNINFKENGLIRLSLPAGKNNVEIIFKETPVRIFADLLSILGLVALFALLFLGKNKKYEIIK